MKLRTGLSMCAVVVSLLALPVARGDCPSVVTGDDAIRVLTKTDPNRIVDSDKPCVSASINLLIGLHSVQNIPLLISYLSYHRELEEGEAAGFTLHPPIEGNEYPAVVALSVWAEDVRVPLLVVIESNASSELERNNAAHAILLTFLKNSEFNGGIQYLRASEAAIGPSGKRNIESALKYLQTVPACIRFKQECNNAFR
jgi:hypothetical protein